MANFLVQTRVGDFIHPKVIASLTLSDTVHTILQVLNSNKVLSAPVCDLSSNAMVGIVSMADIAIALLSFLGAQEQPNRDVVGNIESVGEEFMKTTTAKVLGISQIFGKYNEINYPIRLSSPLAHVLELFCSNVHRVPVLSETNVLTNYLTQTEVIQFLAQSLYLLGDKALLTVETLGICNFGKVVTVRETETVMNTIKILASHNISAVPIVDEFGKLLANFSLSNLKGLQRKNFSELFLSVTDFLQLQRIKETENFMSINNSKSLRPQTCKSTDTFEATVYKLVATRIHRLWVVDPHMRVIGVISIGDLFKPFLNEPPPQMPIT